MSDRRRRPNDLGGLIGRALNDHARRIRALEQGNALGGTTSVGALVIADPDGAGSIRIEATATGLLLTNQLTGTTLTITI